MNPDRFLHLAESLASAAGSGPAEHRSAVSRAYYAAYLCARDMLKAIPVNLNLGTVSEHQAIQRLLVNCQVEVAEEVGSQLQSLHECRKIADYNLNDATYEDAEESKLCIERARIIIGNIVKCVGDKGKISAGIQQYRNKIKA